VTLPRLTVGSIVTYILTAADVTAIGKQHSPGKAYRGNAPVAGQHYAAIVTAAAKCAVNLQVLLDGNGIYWVSSCSTGSEPGQWSWPHAG
jgi:hypothetical protein